MHATLRSSTASQRFSRFVPRLVHGTGLLAALSAVFLLDGCASHHPKHQPLTVRHQAYFSPNGEMLSGGPLGEPSCEKAYGDWFDRLDSARTGTITRDIFMADAEAQFKVMDLNHDGFIVPDELSQYRAKFNFDPSLGFAIERPSGHGEDSDDHPRHKDNADPNAPDWATKRWTPDSADPVMSADRSLKFKVSHADFMVQADEVFGKLDEKHDGIIPKDRILAVCPKPKPVEDHSWF